jgi:hypothetical protein
MKLCPFCQQTLRNEATVCKHCTRAVPAAVGLDPSHLTAAFLVPMSVALVGFFAMIISTQTGAPRGLVVPGWLITWLGVGLLLKGSGAVVRIGGAFILSLVLMAFAVSCGAR